MHDSLRVCPAELAAPEVVAGLREAVPAAQFFDWRSGVGFGLARACNDLLFGETLFHVQPPGYWGWTLKLALLKSGASLLKRQPFEDRLRNSPDYQHDQPPESWGVENVTTLF